MVPFWLAFAVPAELRIIMLLRIVRFLTLARYSPALRSLLEALYSERRALFGCVVILAGAILITAGRSMHLVEGDVQLDKFGTIPDAMWWSLVTLGTVGYGDVVPMTTPGKLFAAADDPVLVRQGGAPGRHRRDRVLGADPSARLRRDLGHGGEGAAIRRPGCRGDRRHHAALARPDGRSRRTSSCAAATTPIRCISSPGGKYDIDIAGKHTGLGVGQFLRRDCGAAPGTALRHRDGHHKANLLVLDASDFHVLMEHEPRIAARVHAAVRERVGLEAVSPKGDIASGELSGAEEER